MRPEMIKHILESIQSDKHQTYGKFQLEALVKRLLTVGEDAAESGFSHIIADFNRLPTPHELIQVFEKEQSKINMANAHKAEGDDKKQRVETPKLSEIKGMTPYDTDSVALVRAMMSDIKPQEKLDLIEAQASKFPGHEWRQVHDDMQVFYEQRGLL